LKDLKKRWSR